MLVTDSLNHFSLSFDLFHEMLFKLFLHASNYNVVYVFHFFLPGNEKKNTVDIFLSLSFSFFLSFFLSSQITYFNRKT